jgi:hypothetical protein
VIEITSDTLAMSVCEATQRGDGNTLTARALLRRTAESGCPTNISSHTPALAQDFLKRLA